METLQTWTYVWLSSIVSSEIRQNDNDFLEDFVSSNAAAGVTIGACGTGCCCAGTKGGAWAGGRDADFVLMKSLIRISTYSL